MNELVKETLKKRRKEIVPTPVNGKYMRKVEIDRRKRKDAKIRAKKSDGGELAVVQTDKLDLFLEEYVNNGGNATKAAAVVYNCSTAGSAQTMGSKMLAKARDRGRLVLERLGWGEAKLVQHALEKMEDSKTPEWWDRMMKYAGHYDFLAQKQVQPSGPAVVNIVESQKKLLNKYVQGEVIEDETDDNEE